MSEIQRWEVDNIISSKTHYKFEKGRYVLYEDHVAAMQAVLPQPKFTVGDRVTWKRMQGSRIVESSIFRPYNNKYEYYIKGTGKLCLSEDDLELYVPTPAELIPTLKEHEWVQGTYLIGSKEDVFGPATTYTVGLLLYAGETLLRGEISGVNNQVATIERCDAPEVVK